MDVLNKVIKEIEEARNKLVDMSDEEPELVDVEEWFDEGVTSGKVRAYNSAIEIIKKYLDFSEDSPKASMEEWILLPSKLPEEGQEVWISTKTDCVRRGIYTKRYGYEMKEGFLCEDGFMWMNTAVAWMPYVVPQAYNLKKR